MVRKPQASLARRIFLGNLRNKGTSLVFAILIWVFAFSNTKLFDTIEVEVTIESPLAEDLVVLETHAETESGPVFSGIVSLTLEGPRSLIAQTLEGHKENRIVGTVVVSETGSVLLDDSSIYSSLPAGISVASTEPRQVFVRLDRLETREIDIQRSTPNFSTSPRFATPTPADFTYEPKRLAVTGPSTLLEAVELTLSKLDVTAYDKPEYDARHPVTIENAIHPAIEFADGVDPTVRVRVALTSALESRDFTVPVYYAWSRARNPGPFGLPVGDPEVEMTCKGTPRALEQLAERVRDGEFRILITLEDFSGTPQSVRSDQFHWPAGALPTGIEQRSIQFTPGSIVYQVDRLGGRDDEGQE